MNLKTSNDYPDTLIDWDLFVLRHQNKKNVVVHFFSFICFWISPILAIFVHPLFIIGFFSSGLIGTAGHYFFADGTVDAKEATSSLQVVEFSSKMAFLFLTGKYWQEIDYVNAKWIKYNNGEITSTAKPEMFSKLGSNT